MATLRVMRPWSVFFLLVTVSIVVTMMVPALFGLQNVTQWGAMYTDAWCRGAAYEAQPHAAKQSMDIYNGMKPAVFSSVMMNREMCTVWLHKFCGQTLAAGWTVAWITPIYKKEDFLRGNNLCDIRLDPAYAHWFTYAP